MQQHPAQALEQLAILAAGLPPRFLAYLVDGFDESLDDMESVQDELGVGAVLADSADEGLAHIAAGPADMGLLEGAERVPEERIDRFPRLALADPDDTGTFQVIDDGGVFMAPGVGDLVDAQRPQPTDAMACTSARDEPMQLMDTVDGARPKRRAATTLRTSAPIVVGALPKPRWPLPARILRSTRRQRETP